MLIPFPIQAQSIVEYTQITMYTYPDEYRKSIHECGLHHSNTWQASAQGKNNQNTRGMDADMRGKATETMCKLPENCFACLLNRNCSCLNITLRITESLFLCISLLVSVYVHVGESEYGARGQLWVSFLWSHPPWFLKFKIFKFCWLPSPRGLPVSGSPALILQSHFF